MLLPNELKGNAFGDDLVFTGEVPVDLNFVDDPALMILREM